MKFDRPFVMFSYEISHGLLLLRSAKSPLFPNRVDVLFQDVRAIECRTSFDELVIEEEEESFLDNVRSRARDVVEPGLKVYSLTCGDWSGYVVGGLVSQCEDDKEFFDPSSLFGTPLAEKMNPRANQ